MSEKQRIKKEKNKTKLKGGEIGKEADHPCLGFVTALNT